MILICHAQRKKTIRRNVTYWIIRHINVFTDLSTEIEEEKKIFDSMRRKEK